jgi:hypothetical protein
VNTTTKEIHSLGPLSTQSNAAKLAAQALYKVSLETIVNVLLWAVELYVLAFFLKQFLG